MRILLSNDDGIVGKGLRKVYRALLGLHEVTVVVPLNEKSASGHSITLHRPLKVEKLEEEVEFWVVDGTPVDCVKFAIKGLKIKPDFIMAGINIGTNLGFNVYYSGTVAVAREGAMHGIASMALSVPEEGALDDAIDFLKIFIENPLKLPNGFYLNINVPKNPKGIKLTVLGKNWFKEYFEKRVDPQGRKYYWLTGEETFDSTEGTDGWAVKNGFISVTPLYLGSDSTTPDQVAQWISEIEKLWVRR